MIIFENTETVAIATFKSTNDKTGNMVQIWILHRLIHPVELVKSGLDASTICKGCPFASGNGCYVEVGKAPSAVWRKYRKGGYPRLEVKDYGKFFANRKVRFGAYGNPSEIPLAIVKAIAKSCKGWTGYFHNWQTMNPTLARGYARFFMVSTETESSQALADSLGYRSFSVNETQPKDSIVCLNTTKNLECIDCCLCDGLSRSRSAPSAKQLPNIWVPPHGSKKKKAISAANN